jgi:hypothetical protein
MKALIGPCKAVTFSAGFRPYRPLKGCCAFFPGPALRSSPGFHIAGFQPSPDVRVCMTGPALIRVLFRNCRRYLAEARAPHWMDL